MPLTLKVPTHLDGRNPIVGRYTAREIVPAVVGVFIAAGVVGQPHLPPLVRLVEALTAILLGGAIGLLRPGARSLPTWGRVLASYLSAERTAVWQPSAVPAAAALAPEGRRPPHLARAATTAPRVAAAPPQVAAAAPSLSRPATQHQPFVPIEIDDDTVTFADGHRCAVLECSGANIEAMEEEQARMLHAAYHTFLLALAFPVQILLCADPVELGPYVAYRAAQLSHLPLAARRLGSADSAYMRRAMARLGGLEQHVYVVIAADLPTGLPLGAGTDLLSLLRRQRAARSASDAVGRSSDAVAPEQQLAERCAALREGLTQAGVQVWRLDTPALRDLYYRRLCPRSARLQPLDEGHLAPLTLGSIDFMPAASVTAGEEADDA